MFAVFIHRCLGRGGAVVSRRKTEHTDLQYPVSSDVRQPPLWKRQHVFQISQSERKRIESKRVQCSLLFGRLQGPVAERAIATSNNTQ